MFWISYAKRRWGRMYWHQTLDFDNNWPFLCGIGVVIMLEDTIRIFTVGKNKYKRLNYYFFSRSLRVKDNKSKHIQNSQRDSNYTHGCTTHNISSFHKTREWKEWWIYQENKERPGAFGVWCVSHPPRTIATHNYLIDDEWMGAPPILQ